MKLSWKLAMLLHDMEPHKLGEWSEYLSSGVDPRQAVKRYLSRRGSKKGGMDGVVATIPLAEQIDKGFRYMMNDCLWRMEKMGAILLPETRYGDGTDWREVTVQLTTEGLGMMGGKKDCHGQVMNEIKRLWVDGRCTIEFHLD